MPFTSPTGENEDVVHKADVEETRLAQASVEFVEKKSPDQWAQRTAERNAALVVPEHAAALGGAPQVPGERA